MRKKKRSPSFRKFTRRRIMKRNSKRMKLYKPKKRLRLRIKLFGINYKFQRI